MNRLEHLLTCISEESGEVVQAVGKIQRFSLTEQYPDTDITNWQQLKTEMIQLVAVYQMVCDEIGDEKAKLFDWDLMQEKKNKVIQYMNYAKQTGALDQ